MNNEPKAGQGIDPELLAAYIDQRLSPEQRAIVEAQLASDPDSYELLVETLNAVESIEGARRQHGRLSIMRSPYRRVWLAAGAIAAAAALVLAVRIPGWRSEDPAALYVERLVEATRDDRVVAGRLTGGFAHAPLRVATRSAAPDQLDNLALLSAAAEIQGWHGESNTPRSRHVLGIALLQLGRFEDALTQLFEAHREAPSAVVASDLAAALIAAAGVTDRPDYWAQAADMAAAATKLTPTMPEPWFNLALALEELGARPAAIHAWDEYLKIDSTSPWASEARQHRERLNAEASVSNRPASPWEQPCLAEVNRLFENGFMASLGAAASQCLRQLDRPADRIQAEIFAAIGAYYDGRAEVALTSLRALLTRPEAADSPLLSGRIQHLLSVVTAARGDYYGGLRYASAAQAVLAETNGDRLASHQTAAEILRALGEDELAWRHYVWALSAIDSVAPLRRHALLNSVGLAASGQRLIHLAILIYQAADQLAEGASAPAMRAEARFNLARALLASGDVGAARAAVAAARAELSAVDDPSIRARQRLEILKVEAEVLEQVDPTIAIESSAEAIAGYQDRGFRFRIASLHLVRARSLRVLGDQVAAERELWAGIDLIESEQAWLEERRLRVSHLDRSWQLYEDLIDLRLEDGRSTEALELLERARGRMSRAKARVWLPQLRQHLDADTTVLVYLQVQGKLHRWAVVREGTSYRVGQALSDDVLRLDSEARLQTVGSALLSGLTRSDIRSRLIVVPDDAWPVLPLSVLKAPQMDSDLLSAVSVAYAPSLGGFLESETRSRANARQHFIGLVGPGRSELRLAPLAHGLHETIAAGRQYPRYDVVPPESATLPNLLHALQSADVIHFAGHAVADDSSAWQSRLILSASEDDVLGVFTVASVETRPLSGAIVVLAGCQTAQGRQFRGSGIVSLGSAFLAAGAAAVVATLADIEDAATASLFERLHEGLSRGLPASLALRQALAGESSLRLRRSVVAIGS